MILINQLVTGILVSANIFLDPQKREIVVFSIPLKLYSSNLKGLSFILRFSFPIFYR